MAGLLLPLPLPLPLSLPLPLPLPLVPSPPLNTFARFDTDDEDTRLRPSFRLRVFDI
jgi:hypothetical protein